MPEDNDSPFLLDPHRRGLPNLHTMARHSESAPVDLVVVGAGAGGVTLAQRLARKGWRIVVLEKGPFWDPDRDWVSDEKGSAGLYWNENRIIGGTDPIQMGKNNSGVGVGGSMTHFAGYVPRFHPSDFEVRTRDGVAADWPISYRELKESFERVERELPVAGEHWPWGDPHDYPHAPHPVCGAALKAWEGARACGIEMRVGPVSITNGSFGNRPHCIYRGFCLQGCKVNAKASPLITHLPDAIAHGVEVRADSMATRIEVDEARPRAGRRLRPRRAGVLPAGGRRRRLRLRDRDAAPAAQLDERTLPARARQQRRPGRAVRDGAGRDPGRRALPGDAPDVQGAAAGDLERAVLRDGRRARLRARLLDPDDLAAADRLGRARDRRGPLGPRAPRVHARLQPLVGARLAVRAAAAGREPRHALRRNGSLRRTRRDVPVTASARTTRRTSPSRRR